MNLVKGKRYVFIGRYIYVGTVQAQEGPIVRIKDAYEVFETNDSEVIGSMEWMKDHIALPAEAYVNTHHIELFYKLQDRNN